MRAVVVIAKAATTAGLILTILSMIDTYSRIRAQMEAGEHIATRSSTIDLALASTTLGLLTALPLVAERER